jgi:hypothetical protein
MDPFSIATGALGTFGVALQTTQALIQLVGDVQGAPEEVTAASKEAESFAGVLKNIQDQVDNGTNELPYFWPLYFDQRNSNSFHFPRSRSSGGR